MLIGGIIEKWNVIIDLENKKIPFTNYELLSHCLTKIASAYPYRLKRLLMINSSSKQEELKNRLIQFQEHSESEAKVMIIGSWNELGRFIPED
jgi:cupin superfamily acireductone dioxygenase involved in methionine salvage